jgi:hypothetical protein
MSGLSASVASSVKASGIDQCAGGVAPFVSGVGEVLFVATVAIVTGSIFNTFILR